MDPIEERELNSLVTQYLNVANVALDQNEDKTPFKQLLSASQKVLSDKRMGMTVYEKDASSPLAHFTLGMKDKRLEMLAHGKQDVDFTFKAKRAYLENVVEHQDEYIEHPTRLDWDWLKSRVGLSP